MSDIIKTKVTTKHPDFGKNVQVWERDYTDVTREELIQLADRSVVIDLQAKARRVKDSDEWQAWNNTSISIRDMLDNKPQRKSEEEKLDEMISKADPETLKAILAAKGIELE